VELLNHVRLTCGDRLTGFEILSATAANAVFSHRRKSGNPLTGAPPGMSSWNSPIAAPARR